jgi:hypothetical protein
MRGGLGLGERHGGFIVREETAGIQAALDLTDQVHVEESEDAVEKPFSNPLRSDSWGYTSWERKSSNH